MRAVPSEAPSEVGTPSTLLELPHPDGGLERFRVIESPVMAPELAAKFPEIRTYRGQGVDDPTASVRFEVTPRGFSAMVLSAFGAWYVDPWTRGVVDLVGSYHRRDALRDPESPFECQAPGTHGDDAGPGAHATTTDLGPTPFPLASVGPTLRTYRLALATTGEYSVAVCGASPTKACVAAELVVAVNRVTGIYEREVAVRMTLVAGNDAVIYLDGATDPYTNGNASSLLSENQGNLDSVIGSASYDIGHVFSTGGGGLAGLGVVCRSGLKARGETGSSNPTGDPFWVDYVAHEMGHQFGGNHTFNGSLSNCQGNRVSSAAYEPGSGSTIMAYAGICSSQNLQPNSDPYFHGKSFDEIVTYTSSGSGASCAAASATSNSAPAVEAGASYTVPSRTPFALTGSATDPEGDALTLGWEEFDLGTVEPAPPLVDSGNRPIFRSFNPTVSPTRTFPKPSDVLSGTTTYGETMPTTSRTMNFRLTARDNRGGGGGVASDATTVTSVSAAGPFAVTAPATAVIWAGDSTQTVTWNVAGTTAAPISCSNVEISLSVDGGQTFPATLLASTPNDGSQAITVPNTPTAGPTARVRVACVGNVFFAISRPSFTIGTPPPPPTVSTIVPSSGSTAGGTAVTITGTNLSSTTAVTFGGTAATSFTVSSATQVAATTPAHAAGVVDVVVTTSGGTSTSTGGFTFVAPAPTIASVAPGSGSTLGGTTVTITGTNLSGATVATFGGTAVTSLTLISAAQVRVTTPAHAAGAVDVAVTTPGGTATKTAGFSYLVPTPTIASVSPTSGSTLGGTVVTITGTNLTGASAVTFGGAAAASFTVDSTTQVTATTPAHAAGAVNVVVTTPGGAATRTGGFTYVSRPDDLDRRAGRRPGGGREPRHDHRDEPDGRHGRELRRQCRRLVHRRLRDADQRHDPRAPCRRGRRQRHDPPRRRDLDGRLHLFRRSLRAPVPHGRSLPGRRHPLGARRAFRGPRPPRLAGGADVHARSRLRRPGRCARRLDERHRHRIDGGRGASRLRAGLDPDGRDGHLLPGREDPREQRSAPRLRLGGGHRPERRRRRGPPRHRRERLLPVDDLFRTSGRPARAGRLAFRPRPRPAHALRNQSDCCATGAAFASRAASCAPESGVKAFAIATFSSSWPIESQPTMTVETGSERT